MNSISTIANSALQAFSTRQQLTAHNIANVNTDGFEASKTLILEGKNQGVSVAVVGTEDTVDISREATNLVSNSNGFKANLTVLKVADEMTRELFSIKA